jgi:hypothetical protein
MIWLFTRAMISSTTVSAERVEGATTATARIRHNKTLDIKHPEKMGYLALSYSTSSEADEGLF